MEFNRAQHILKIERPLATAAVGYFVVGMQEFHRVRGNVHLPFQVSLGNLSISIELMLKALIAKKSFVLLYEALPLDLQVKLLYPDKTKPVHLSRVEEMGLTHFTFKTAELDRCIATFYSLFPENKQLFKSSFDLLAVNRNSCVHAVVQGFQRYDLERVAYLAVRLIGILKEEKVDVFGYRSLTKEDEAFLQRYDSERVERVKKAISKARDKSKGVEGQSFIIQSSQDWSNLVQRCPICSSEGLLMGYTDMTWDHVDGADSLLFYAEGFRCESCGLELTDSTEIELAGMSQVIERESDVDAWIEEFGYPDPPFLEVIE